LHVRQAGGQVATATSASTLSGLHVQIGQQGL
jgi:hypothetical protein